MPENLLAYYKNRILEGKMKSLCLCFGISYLSFITISLKAEVSYDPTFQINVANSLAAQSAMQPEGKSIHKHEDSGHIIQSNITQVTIPSFASRKGRADLPVQPFALSQVELLDSPFKENRDRTLSYLRFLDPDRMLHMFRVSSGLSSSAQPLGGWDSPNVKLRGHSMGHYLVALSQAYASTRDTQYKNRVDYLVKELGKCQDAFFVNSIAEYGFLSAYDESQFEDLEKLTTYPTIWAPYYTLHKIFSGLIASYYYTQNTQALNIAKKLGLWVYNRLSKLSQSRLDQMWALYIAGEYGGMNEVLAELYAITGDSRYLISASYFDNKGLFDPTYDNHDQLAGKHANQHIPQIVGALKMYDQNNDNYYYQVAKNFWYMVAEHHSYINGGTGEGEMFKPEGKIAAHITDKTGETCATYNMLKLTRQLFFHDPRPEYMDYYEKSLYNHILASQNPASHHGFVTYFVPLNPGGRKSYSNDYHSFTCCHGTGMENHTKYQESIYFHSADNSTLYVNLFIPSILNWESKGFEIKQETRYPLEDQSLITVEGHGELTIKLRVPYWIKDGYVVKVNESIQNVTPRPGTYITLKRKWREGDQISIEIPFSLRLERTPDDYNTGGILYGPVLLTGKSNRINWINLELNTSQLDQSIAPLNSPLNFTTNGITLVPFYKAYNFRYHAYFRINE